MTFEWPYFRLRHDGVLVDDETGIPLAIANDGSTPYFASTAEAEAWLTEQDIRGNVR